MTTNNWPTRLHCGVLTGLTLLLACPAAADEALRKRVHKEYRHQSYMLLEYADSAWLYLFDEDSTQRSVVQLAATPERSFVDLAIARTGSANPRTRVRGLTELAGVDSQKALDMALALLADPDAAVRDEAANLILDHPRAEEVVVALGLIDEDEADE